MNVSLLTSISIILPAISKSSWLKLNGSYPDPPSPFVNTSFPVSGEKFKVFTPLGLKMGVLYEVMFYVFEVARLTVKSILQLYQYDHIAYLYLAILSLKFWVTRIRFKLFRKCTR